MYNNKNNNNNDSKKKKNKNNNRSNIELYINTHTQRIRGADKTLAKFWADVVDGGQHWTNQPRSM